MQAYERAKGGGRRRGGQPGQGVVWRGVGWLWLVLRGVVFAVVVCVAWAVRSRCKHSAQSGSLRALSAPTSCVKLLHHHHHHHRLLSCCSLAYTHQRRKRRQKAARAAERTCN